VLLYIEIEDYKRRDLMANIKAAIKYIRKSRKNRIRNLAVKGNVKKLFKLALKLISSKDKGAAEAVINATSAVDKAAENGILHKNTAARKKSRLMKKFNAISKK
jgi:small subunit ribosomal protein S20